MNHPYFFLDVWGSGTSLLRVTGWALLWLGFIAGIALLGYYQFSLPLRRKERARLFLHLLSQGLQEGRSAEDTIGSIAASRDRTVGVHFHWLAACLEAGLPLADALDRVPSLLPPRVRGMLKTGLRLGDLPRVLPACRYVLDDANARIWKAQNYMAVLMFGLLPVSILLLQLCLTFVFPRLRYLNEDLGAHAWPERLFSIAESPWVQALPVLICGLVILGVAIYSAGPNHFILRCRPMARFADWVQVHVPWRRKRLFRDFAGILAVLLDSGVPEEKALVMAAEATVNRWMLARARRVVSELREGKGLAEVVAMVDASGEFGWRFRNAAQSQAGFVPALAGWVEALDAKAFQQEQAAAQVLSTAMVLVNGLVVGLLAVVVFEFLINIIEVVSV